ncbi:MAG: hypothetical protein GH151_14720 [Bacteroidetes bacterium]|nr:hypothetical protein [Bacteroidota bacterium]
MTRNIITTLIGVELNTDKKCQHTDKFITKLYLGQRVAATPYPNQGWKICTNTSGVFLERRNDLCRKGFAE